MPAISTLYSTDLYKSKRGYTSQKLLIMMFTRANFSARNVVLIIRLSLAVVLMLTIKWDCRVSHKIHTITEHARTMLIHTMTHRPNFTFNTLSCLSQKKTVIA
jgi:hypothetical protein